MIQTTRARLNELKTATRKLSLNQGAQYMLMSTFWFSLMQVCIKKLRHIPSMEIVFFRCFVSMMLCLIPLWHKRISWLGNNRLLLFLRGTFGTIALFSSFVILQHMPLVSAVTLQYLSPIFAALIAVFFLGERVRVVQWLFFALSFAGIIVLKGFDPRIELRYLFVGILCALFTGLAYTLVRSLKEREHPLVVVLHFQLIGVLAGLVSLFFQFRLPQGRDWLYLLLVGIFTQLGQINVTKSLQSERVAFVMSLNYLGIVFVFLLGFFFFGETVDLFAAFGIVMVIAGVILNLAFGRKEDVIEESQSTTETL
jgi:drug/metabolite transporter (DMT)-like permease